MYRIKANQFFRRAILISVLVIAGGNTNAYAFPVAGHIGIPDDHCSHW